MFGGYILINRYVYITYKVDVFNYVITFSLWAAFFALLDMCVNRYRKKFKIIRKSTIPVALTGMLAGIGVGFIVVGGKYTTAINASILATSSIIPTVLFTQLMLKEKLNRAQYVWLLAMLAGLYLAIVGLQTISLNKGDIIILGSALILGYTNTYTKILMKQNISDFVSDVRLVGAGLLFWAVGVVFIGKDFFVTNAGLWPVIGGLSYWLTIKFFYASIHHINPGKAIVLLNGHPAITPIIGILVLSEPYSHVKFLGSVLILVSIYFINKK